MWLRSFPCLLDQNVPRAFEQLLRDRGLNIVTARELSLSNAPDSEVLGVGNDQDRVIWTFDPDFGLLAQESGKVKLGVVLLRPGHLPPSDAAELAAAALDAEFVFEPPFFVVVAMRQGRVSIRGRSLT